MELKWVLAIACEVAFWTLFVSFLVLRYRYGRDDASIMVLIAIIADHVAVLALGVWDYVETGKVNLFTLFVLGILLYAFTLGRRHTERVDAWAKRRFTPRRPSPPEARSAPLPPR